MTDYANKMHMFNNVQPV